MDKKDKMALRKDVLRSIRWNIKNFAHVNGLGEPEPISLGLDTVVYRVAGKDLYIPVVYFYRYDGRLDSGTTGDYYHKMIKTLWEESDIASDQDIDLSSMVITEFGDKEQQ